jgi:hypothetical protein
MGASFFIWLQDTGFFSALRDSTWVYPIILSLHIIALTFFGGAVIAADLRLLGVGMRGYSISDLIDGMRQLKRIGFVFTLTCGLLLFGAGAARYSVDPWFWIKIALLALVAVNYLVFRRHVYNNAAELDRSPQMPSRAKLAASLSLVLWTGVICAARGPATIKDIMHSMVDPTGDAVFESVQEIADNRGIRVKAPRTDADWQDVRRHLQILEDVPDLVTAEGRMAAHFTDRSRNPQVEDQPEDVQKLLDADRPSLLRRAKRLHDTAALAMKAVDAKDQHGLLLAIDGIDKACENCHLHYWYPNDKRAQQAAKEDGVTDQ